MHPFSTDSKERFWIPFAIIIISIFLALASKFLWEQSGLNEILGSYYLIISIFVDFSVLLYYELIHFLFNHSLWKFSWMPFVKIPDMNGIWKGTLYSSFTEDGSKEKTKVDATMEITQTWQDIVIRLKTDSSISETVTAAFFTKNQNAIKLTYQFESKPKPHSGYELHDHKGTGWITLSHDKKTFEGDYYNGRDRGNFGSLKFTKTSKWPKT
ncbi:hypothetical protein [Methanobacterium alcaliphilum]|uniref:Cap15 family cyclic dinucleotide receptor domain-containing protein n=1 Tax=Methanobacterium alcaliphilum TaxID=392018 RepID=UPI00200A0246|nr:hypothetical protein [Methanobacterium alcaliphilum]MCK9150482.1 hypothetical protein [Methanobacterium alcaliphilum]